MDKPFYVTDGMNKIGPFSKDEVLQLLYNAHISIMDYVVDARDNRMCPLLQHEDFGGDGGTHSLVSTSGIAGLSNKSLSEKYGFGELRKKTDVLRENKMAERQKKKQQIAQSQSHLREVIEAKPELAAEIPAPVTQKKPSQYIEIDEQTTTTQLKTNNSTSFYLKVKDKEYGPLKFLILLSLLKQNKITLEAQTRSEFDTDWKKLSDYLPNEIQQTISVTPILSQNVLPKNLWKRKNVRVDYEEVVLFNNARYSLVGKSIDLSAEGIAVLWVYDIPVNEEFELSLFDLEKNLITVKGRLARKEPMDSQAGMPLFKAVFLFREKIEIKQFIK